MTRPRVAAVLTGAVIGVVLTLRGTLIRFTVKHHGITRRWGA